MCCYDRERECCRTEGGNCAHPRAKPRSKEAPREPGNSILAAPRPTGDPIRDRCSSGLFGILRDVYAERLFSSAYLSNAAFFLLDCPQWLVRGLGPRNSSDSPFDVRNQILFRFAATQFRVYNGRNSPLHRLFLVGCFVSWLSFRQRRDEELARQAIIAKERQEAEKAKATALADERNRLAADVHDTLAQAFAATLLHLRSMEMARLAPDLRSHCQFAQQTASTGLAAARRAMNAVRTATPADNRPLPERLAERVRRVSARTTAQVDFHVEGKIAVLLWAVEDEIERLATEALFNAERHAAASQIIVKLDYLPEPGLRLRVHDNGRGFDQTQVIGGGLGLRAMHERAERIGATFTLITESGQGTEVIVLWTSAVANTGPETNRLKGTL